MMIPHRQSLAIGLLAALSLFLPLQASAAQQPATRPNMVFIMADDMGYGNLGCYGGKSIKKPNIDAMCQEDMRFGHRPGG